MHPLPPSPTVTEADLHALVDNKLSPERQREVEAWLADRPGDASRVEAYRAQTVALRALFDPVLHEPVPPRLRVAAQRRASFWPTQSLAAGLLVALISGGAGWGLRGGLADAGHPVPVAGSPTTGSTLASAAGFAQRAVVAHAVYTPDQRRPVEIDAAHEDQLITWLSKRMGATLRPPRLQALGYALEGGRLLPGSEGPVAQFMYQDAAGTRLTLYVSNEVGDLKSGKASSGTEFRFAQQGELMVFYWVDGAFGYAISAAAGREALAGVSAEVYRQLQVTGVGN
ncbi:MAG: anti-sigma factor [Chitinophagaceae bacterium]|nr:anti-sigma factor [Rubrivivax sp.]